MPFEFEVGNGSEPLKLKGGVGFAILKEVTELSSPRWIKVPRAAK